MTPVINDNGTMTDPDFHDGLLLGILLSPDHEDLTLFCRRTDGSDFRLTLPGIVGLRADNFLQGNIIYEISVRAGSQCPAQALERLWNYDEDEARQHLPKRMKEIEDGCWTLLEVSTSYGCELLALCRGHADQITVT